MIEVEWEALSERSLSKLKDLLMLLRLYIFLFISIELTKAFTPSDGVIKKLYHNGLKEEMLQKFVEYT